MPNSTQPLKPAWGLLRWFTRLARNDSAQPVGPEDGLEHRREVGTAAQHLAAVDVNHLTGDVARRVAEQEHGRLRDVLHLAGPRQRRACCVISADLWRLENRLD